MDEETKQEPLPSKTQKKKTKKKQRKKAALQSAETQSPTVVDPDHAPLPSLCPDLTIEPSAELTSEHHDETQLTDGVGGLELSKAQKKNRRRKKKNKGADVVYEVYSSEAQIEDVMRLVDNELSEPYSIFTYRFFLHQWPDLTYIARVNGKAIGTIVCKADHEHDDEYSGYIAMLVVEKPYRSFGLGSKLVELAVEKMRSIGCTQIVLEAEITNSGALSLYEKLGFVRAERMSRYYLNGNDAFRLKLWFPPPSEEEIDC